MAGKRSTVKKVTVKAKTKLAGKKKAAKKTAKKVQAKAKSSGTPLKGTKSAVASAKAKAQKPFSLSAKKKASKGATQGQKASVPHALSAKEPEVFSEERPVRARKVTKAQLLAQEKMNRMTKKWETLQKKAKGIKAQPYNMKKTFAPKTAIEHKVLGWGFILDNKNDRLEVLFKDGIRYLISNYKA